MGTVAVISRERGGFLFYSNQLGHSIVYPILCLSETKGVSSGAIQNGVCSCLLELASKHDKLAQISL